MDASGCQARGLQNRRECEGLARVFCMRGRGLWSGDRRSAEAPPIRGQWRVVLDVVIRPKIAQLGSFQPRRIPQPELPNDFVDDLLWRSIDVEPYGGLVGRRRFQVF